MRYLLSVLIGLASLPAIANADVVLIDNQAEFEMAAASAGKLFKGVEDFEGLVGQAGTFALPDPILQFGVPNVTPGGFGYPDGLSVSNLMLETTIPDELFPIDPNFGNDFFGNSTIALATNSGEPLTLSFLGDPKTAVGFNAATFMGLGSFGFTILDTNGQTLLDDTFPGSFPLDDTFFGFLATDGDLIGSVTVQVDDGNFFAVDNIQVWQGIPEPSTTILGLIGLVGLIGRRRR